MTASLPSTVIYSPKSVHILFAEYFSSKTFSLVYLHFHLQFLLWASMQSVFPCRICVYACVHDVFPWNIWSKILIVNILLCNNSKTCIMRYLMGGKCNFGQTLKTQTRMNGSYKRYNILVGKGKLWTDILVMMKRKTIWGNSWWLMSIQGEEYEDVPSPLLPPDLAYLPPTGASLMHLLSFAI